MDKSTTPAPRRCLGCGMAHYLPSLADARWCYRCAIVSAWTITLFGKIRKVPPRLAARWS